VRIEQGKMKHETHEVRLSPEQLDYLRRTFSRDESFAGLLKHSSGANKKESVIRLNRDDAERLRARLTEHLAKVGFDKDYALTPQGELLEELIDQFALPSPD
jgi:type VI protein secretion system component VasA